MLCAAALTPGLLGIAPAEIVIVSPRSGKGAQFDNSWMRFYGSCLS